VASSPLFRANRVEYGMTTISAEAQPSAAGSTPRAMPLYQLFMLALCVLALAGIVVQNAFQQDPEIDAILDVGDFLICIAFGIDFIVSLWTAPNRMHYLITWGWLDLLSSIPMLDVARWGRIARIARITRVLRSIRAARVLSTVILTKRRQSTLLAATLLVLVLIIASSTAILHYPWPPQTSVVYFLNSPSSTLRSSGVSVMD